MKKAKLFSGLLMVATLCGWVAALPQSSAAQAPQASPFKDRAEYDSYNAIVQATDPAQQLAAAEKYLAAYPQSKLLENVYTVEIQDYQKLGKVPELEAAANKVLAINPKNLSALFWLSTIFPQTFNPQDPAADQKMDAAVQHAKAGLEQTGSLAKPANISDDDFKKQKDALDIAFHQALGFVALQKKDYAGAADELHKAVAIDPSNAATLYQLGVADRSMEPSKTDEAIWAIGRAIAITGPGALPPANQAMVKDYLSKVYQNVHGSPDGMDDVIKQAGAATTMPADFHIKTAQEIAAAEPTPTPAPTPPPQRESTVKPEELTDFGVIQKYLQAGGQKSEDTWTILKGQTLPLPGKVIAARPAARPTVVELAVAPELQTQDVRFDVEVTLAAPSARPIAKGETKTFEGVVDSFRAKPFLLKIVDAKETK